MTRTTQKRLENLVVKEGVRALNPAYTKLVRWLRLLLPLVAMAIVLALFSWTFFDKDTVVADKSDEERVKEARNELVAPRFESRDSSGRPYSVTAKRATQGKRENGQDEKMIYLEDPSGEMIFDEKRTFSVTAKTGSYHQALEELTLENDVLLTSTDGYMFRTKSVFVSTKKGQARSSSPLQGKGPSGSIEARGFEADNTAGRIVLKGPAKLVIIPEAL